MSKNLSWADIEWGATKLSLKLDLRDYRAILAPNRGALCVAALLQYHQNLTVPVHTDANITPKDKIFKVNPGSETRKLLFLDDMIDSGKEVSEFIGKMLKIKIEAIKGKKQVDEFLFDFDIAVLVVKKQGSLKNVKNFKFGLEIDTHDYIRFPWELNRT